MARGSIDRPTCPTHASENLSEVATGWYCDPCGHRVVGFDDWPGPQEPVGARCRLDDLPSFLALKIADADRETHPVVRLWSICEITEILLRLITAVAAADATRGPGVLPDDFVRSLAEKLRRPTLGGWHDLARYFIVNFPNDPLIPELAADMEGPIGALLTKIKPLRNDLAHGGGITPLFASYRVGPLAAQLARTLAALKWLTDLRFEASTATGPVLLRGQELPTLRDPNAPAPVTVSRPRRDLRLDVFPLLAAVSVSGSPSLHPSIYVRSDDKYLEHLALGQASSFQRLRGDAVHRFRAWFRLDEQSSLLGELRDFDEDCRLEARRVRGRVNETRSIVETVTSEPPPPITWVHGVPGVGKSALVSRVVERLRSTGSLVLFWRFRAGDPRCNRGDFLRHVLSGLEKALGLPKTPFGGELEVLERALASYADRLARPVLLVADGLDEIARLDPTFVDLPLRTATAKCRWLLAGRPEPAITAALGRERCEWAFSDLNGLPPLAADDIAEWLKDEMPSDQVAHYLRHGNQWLDQVVKASGGLPEYLRLLLIELGEGELEVGASLPRGLDAYWQRLMTRAGADDASGLIPFLVAAVCLGEEAPTEAALVETLRAARPAAAARIDHTVTGRAIDRARHLLRFGVNAAGVETLAPCHESLRDHVRSDPAYAVSVEEALHTLAAMSRQPEKCTNPALADTLFRTGVRQLISLGMPNAGSSLLADPAYLIARFGFGPPAFNRDDESAECNERVLTEILTDADLVLAGRPSNDDDGPRDLIRWLRRQRLEVVLGGGRMLFQQLMATPAWRHKTTLRPEQARLLRYWLEGQESSMPKASWSDEMPASVQRLALSRDGRYLCALFAERPPEVVDTYLGLKIEAPFAGAREHAGFDQTGQLHLTHGKEVERWRRLPSGQLDLEGCTTLAAPVVAIFQSSAGPIAITSGAGIAQLVELSSQRVLSQTRDARIRQRRLDRRLDALPLSDGRCLLSDDVGSFSALLSNAGEMTPVTVPDFYSLAVPTMDLGRLVCPDAFGHVRVVSAIDLSIVDTFQLRRARNARTAAYIPLEVAADERGEVVVVASTGSSIVHLLVQREAFVVHHGADNWANCAVADDGSTIALAFGARIEVHVTEELTRHGREMDMGPHTHVVFLRIRHSGDAIAGFADGSAWLYDQSSGQRRRRLVEPSPGRHAPALFAVNADASLLAYTQGQWLIQIDMSTGKESPMCLYDETDGEPYDYGNQHFYFRELVRCEERSCWLAEANDGTIFRSNVERCELLETDDTLPTEEARPGTFTTGPLSERPFLETLEDLPNFLEVIDTSRGAVAWWHHDRKITAHDVLETSGDDVRAVVVFGDDLGDIRFLRLREQAPATLRLVVNPEMP